MHTMGGLSGLCEWTQWLFQPNIARTSQLNGCVKRSRRRLSRKSFQHIYLTTGRSTTSSLLGSLSLGAHKATPVSLVARLSSTRMADGVHTAVELSPGRTTARSIEVQHI